jgi:tetratricopeptide (TPR) repeat protein
MKLDPILTKATRLARSGKYEGAMKILTPEANRYNGSFRYCYLMALCCLYTGDFGNALSYFKAARDMRIRHPGVLLGFAALYLRRQEIERAVDFYLEVQELDEKNRIAKKALGIIRKYAGAGNFSAWLDSGDLPKLFPPFPRAGFSRERIFISAAALFAALVLVWGFLSRTGFFPAFAHRGARRELPGIALTREDRAGAVETEGVFSRFQALNTYNRALGLFTEYRDEAARYQLNRILESNASRGLKNKARLLLSYMETPRFDTFVKKDNFSYAEVIREPLLYRDCHVIWRGMAANAEFLQNLTVFDLLVGYDTLETLEEKVTVVFDKTIFLNPGKPLEVLGRITPVSTEKGLGVRLEGVAIYQPASGVFTD